MASSAIDLAALTPDQQATLQQFTALTNQEIEAAVPLLQRCEWNVQVQYLY
jgi:FAS-associated factor 2